MKVKRTLWSSPSEPILVIMALLIVLGTINVFSSSFVLAMTDFNNPYYFLERHVVILLVGAVCFLICRKVPYKHWRYAMLPILGFVIISLGLVLVIGTSVNGARRWLSIFGIGFQPAEFAKLLSVIMAATYIAAILGRGMRLRLKQLRSVPYAIIFVMACLTELEPDMGTACIIFGVPLLMFFVLWFDRSRFSSRADFLIKAGTGVLCFAGFVFMLAVLQPYRMARIRVMFDPWSDAQGIGYQTVQSLSTIGSGGLWGMGFGEGISKYAYLPEAHTDFAFAIFCQEHGYLGAFLVFFLFTMLLLCCTRVAQTARDTFGQVLALGIMILIVGQAIANIAMVGGMFAVVGVPLPFISYGGSSLIVSMSAIGMLLNICDSTRKPAREAAMPRQTDDSDARQIRLHRVK